MTSIASALPQLWAQDAFTIRDKKPATVQQPAAANIYNIQLPQEGKNFYNLARRLAPFALGALPILVGLAAFSRSYPLAGLAVSISSGFLVAAICGAGLSDLKLETTADSKHVVEIKTGKADEATFDAHDKLDSAERLLVQGRELRNEFPEDFNVANLGKFSGLASLMQVQLLLKVNGIYQDIYFGYLAGYNFSNKIDEMVEALDLYAKVKSLKPELLEVEGKQAQVTQKNKVIVDKERDVGSDLIRWTEDKGPGNQVRSDQPGSSNGMWYYRVSNNAAILNRELTNAISAQTEKS